MRNENGAHSILDLGGSSQNMQHSNCEILDLKCAHLPSSGPKKVSPVIRWGT